MSVEVGFDVSVLDEYSLKLLILAEKTMPKECNKFMKIEANKLNSKAKKNARKKIRKVTGNYIKGFKKGKKVYEYGDTKYNVRVYNSAPHAHLIEYGHYMIGHEPDKKKSKKTGYIKGQHILENTSKEFENEFEKDTIKFSDDVLDKGLSY